MIADFIALIAVLGVVILGMLVMLRAITLDDILAGAGRVSAFAVGTAVLLSVLRMLYPGVVLPWLSSLKAILGWLVSAALAIIVLVLVARLAFSKLHNRDVGFGNKKTR